MSSVVLAVTKLEVKASVQLQPGLLLCSRFLQPLCCAADCLSASLSVRSSLCLSVCLKPARVYLHFSSTSIFMMEAGHSTWRCVCVCVCAQDLIGLWSEGILHTESQVEREQGSHCSECYAFSIVSLLLLLYTRTLLWRWHRTPFH